jgi:2-keto-4-pentenoate hydratase/2-oxohepta-3-ene-1,7-dioic acid hydratase in catechol pathway
MVRQPPRALQPGQVLESWVEGIGEIRNTCVESATTSPAAVVG